MKVYINGQGHMTKMAAMAINSNKKKQQSCGSLYTLFHPEFRQKPTTGIGNTSPKNNFSYCLKLEQ